MAAGTFSAAGSRAMQEPTRTCRGGRGIYARPVGDSRDRAVADQGHRGLDRARRLLILEGVIMTAGTHTDSDFAFAGLATPEAQPTEAIKALAGGPDPLGALAGLLGTWKGHGFNAIWRPHHPASPQDRFLELNKTDETLVFTRINGPIPNRGLAMADIDMFGLTYMQQISESSTGAGLHIEPGIWATVPHTTDPNEPAASVRMASIPHGTAFLATSGNRPGGNAQATQAEATFWIETIAGTGGQPDKHQLQYTQLVMLDFNGIHWPHVTVGTLVRQ